MNANTHVDTQTHRIHSCKKMRKKERNKQTNKQHLRRPKFVADNLLEQGIHRRKYWS